MTENILEVKDLKKQYHGKNRTVDAVKGISFHVERGEIFGFLGPTVQASRPRSIW